MAKTINQIVIATDTFSSLITRTNQVISAIGSEVITANSSNDGANTTGNTNLIGIFGANTIVAGTGIRGGTVNAAANLSITSNAVFTGANAAFNANVNITNSATSINAVAMYVTGPTLTIGSNTTVSGNLNATGTQTTIGSNVVVTGANTTVQSLFTTLASNTVVFTSNTVTVNAVTTTINANTVVSGTINLQSTATVADIQFGSMGKMTKAANGDIGATTGSPLIVFSYPLASYKAAQVFAKAQNGTTTRSSAFVVASNATDVYMTEYGTIHAPQGANLGIFTVSANTTDAIIRFTQTAANSAVSLNITLMT